MSGGGGERRRVRPSRRGWAARRPRALLRPRGEWAQPDAAPRCPRRRRGLGAAADMLSARAAGVDRTKRRGGGGGREDAASPSHGARGPGGRGGAAPLKIAPAEARAGARSCTPHPPTPRWGPGPERAAREVPARALRSRRRNGASSAGTGAGAKSGAAPISGSRHLEKRRTVG